MGCAVLDPLLLLLLLLLLPLLLSPAAPSWMSKAPLSP
jgi:hypothetical protein